MKDVSQSSEQQTPSSGIATTAAGQVELEKFLTARALDTIMAVKLGLTAANGCIEIPYVRNGSLVYKKYRGIKEKTFKCDAGHSPFVWNIDVLDDEVFKRDPLIITEGEFDAMAAMQAGYLRVISVPNGAPAEPEKASMAYLDEIEEKLKTITEVIIASDADAAGANLLHDISLRIGRARCKWVKYPQGCKDLNEALAKYGVKGVQETIKRANWLGVEGIYSMEQLPPRPNRLALNIGIAGFEQHLRIRLGDFSVWTGVPSSGKSTFINDVMCRIATNNRFRIGFASFEQPPQTEHRRTLRTWYSSKFEKTMSESEIAMADKWIDEAFRFVVPKEDDEVSMPWLLERMAALAIRHDVKIIVIDPWNEMDHLRENGETVTEYTGKAIKLFKSFATKYNVHVAVVAHPAKMQRNKDGKYAVPSLYDISDSAHWYNKADLGVVVHRDKEDGDFIQVAKSRYHTEIGKPGIIDVKFSPENARYTVVDNNVMNGDER
jgi:twinkle protein